MRYYFEMNSPFMPNLPVDQILAAYERAPGNELESGKLSSPESSAALAANTFGFFLNRPRDLPPIPGTEACGWPADKVALEYCARFPWSGGTHPWLDAYIETSTHIIGVESKRYEPYRSSKTGEFSEAYWRPVWGDQMGLFERVRNLIRDKEIQFNRLDAAQLVKHAFGLRTEGQRQGKKPALVYLYAEPDNWPDGRPVTTEIKAEHSAEAHMFAEQVTGAEVSFINCSYQALLESWNNSKTEVVRHRKAIIEVFGP